MSDTPMEHDQTTASRKRNRRLAIVASVAVVLVVLIEMLSFEPQTVRTLQPGELISEPGSYRCGSRLITVSETADGFTAVTEKWRQKKFFVLEGTSDEWPNHTIFIPQERDWFACVDEFDRVWIYRGSWDRAWGKPRRYSYAPAVIRIDHHASINNHKGNGITIVSRTGDWAGVPGKFFEHIPDKHDPVWAGAPPLPETAPPFSPAQETLLTRVLQSTRTQLGLE